MNAMNAMKNANEARLLIMLGPPEDGDWHPVFASDTKTEYAYKFEGGKKGRGHLSSVVDPGQKATYTLKLKKAHSDCPDKHKYKIVSVTISGNAFGQVETPTPIDKDWQEWQIIAKREYPMLAYYVVVVERDGDCLTIECDPMISNEPKA